MGNSAHFLGFLNPYVQWFMVTIFYTYMLIFYGRYHVRDFQEGVAGWGVEGIRWAQN